jgi:hypothetical protein
LLNDLRRIFVEFMSLMRRTFMPDVNWDALTAVGTWFGALAAVGIGYLVWKSNKRVEWLTGSMESYQMKELRLAVLNHPEVRLVWWDPSVEPWPHAGKHGEDVKTDLLYVGIPLELRRHGKSKLPPQRNDC